MKCKTCKAPTTNKDGGGNCFLCQCILDMVKMFEYTLNQPNLQGYKRKVKLTAEISKE